MKKKLLLSTALAVFTLGLTACNEKVEQPATDQFLIQSIELQGTTQSPSKVEIGAVRDQDGAADTEWKAAFKLDGADEPGSLPKDMGDKQSHELLIKATRAEDGQQVQKKVTITLHE